MVVIPAALKIAEMGVVVFPVKMSGHLLTFQSWNVALAAGLPASSPLTHPG